MYEKIKRAIGSHIKNHRLVFWYDEEGKHRSVLSELDTPADVIEVENNEWWVKYHVLKEKPDHRYLIYSPTARPADDNNWLLDLVLAGFAFSHDLSETYREELGLGVGFRQFLATHVEFFQNKDRFEPVQEMITPEIESESSLALKMMSVLVARDAQQRRTARSFGSLLFDLCVDSIEDDYSRWNALVKHGLREYFVSELGKYLPAADESIEPYGAALEIVNRAWELEIGGDSTPERRNSRVLVYQWRDSSSDADFRNVIQSVEEALGIRESLKGLSTEVLRGSSLFPSIDSELARRLVAAVVSDASDLDVQRQIAGERRSAFWVRDSQSIERHVYDLIVRFVDFRRTLREIKFTSTTAEQLLDHYVKSLYRVDRLYRESLAAYRAAGSRGSLSEIVSRLEGEYLSTFLQPLAEKWQEASEKMSAPLPEHAMSQRRFFDLQVAPYLSEGKKLVVVISDALRYEAGKRLEEELSARRGIVVDTESAIAAPPTITSVGMAALLPHRTISLTPGGTVSIDGESVSGIEGRSEYLRKAVEKRFPGLRAAAFRAQQIASLPAPAARETINGLDLIYVYSNGIDAAADNAKTETSLPDAVEGEIESLANLVMKFANQLNRTHILITADHGFLYQAGEVESFFLIEAEKPAVGSRERRYIHGGSSPGEHFRTVEPTELGIEAADRLHFVEGLFRIRKQGGGVRYVHGGLSLQELLVPIIRVHVSRSDRVSDVGVVVMKPGNPVITTPEFPVAFFQEDPVSPKRSAITLRAYFAAEDGTTISDAVDLSFESTDEKAQNRSRSRMFYFGRDAAKYNGKYVTLKLEKLIGGTTVPYAEERYRYQTFGERDF